MMPDGRSTHQTFFTSQQKLPLISQSIDGGKSLEKKSRITVY